MTTTTVRPTDLEGMPTPPPALSPRPTPATTTRPATEPVAGPATRTGSLYAWVCEACDLISYLAPTRDVVAALAATHNGLAHSGWPAARVIDLPGTCESCQRTPATLGLLLGLGITPFAVCAGCLHPHHPGHPGDPGQLDNGPEGADPVATP